MAGRRIVLRSTCGRGVDYAELLADQDLEHELSEDAPVLDSSEFHLSGTEVHERLDAIARVTGAAQYSQDIQPEGVLFASVIRPVAYGARARDVDFSVAQVLPGGVETIHDGSLIAVLAELDKQADRAAGGWSRSTGTSRRTSHQPGNCPRCSSRAPPTAS